LSDLISVIVPCYNQAQYLPEALDSVLAQTYTNWECIMVNDGSPDNSEEIALKYCSKDPRFNYLKKENGGLSSARNAGLKIAKGDWVQFLDSDDYIEPEKFKLSMDLITENPSASLIVSDFKMFIDDRLNATPAFCELNQARLNFESILFGWDAEFNIPIHSGLIKADVFVGPPFIETLKTNEDWVMWLNLFYKGVDALYLDYPLAYYRNNPNSMTKDKAFVRESLVATFKYILQTLPAAYVAGFACALVDRYNSVIIAQENDLTYFKNKLPYRIEKSLKDSLGKFLVPKKR
jgi:glycosyltransferase involved in cell wall biosynthesis